MLWFHIQKSGQQISRMYVCVETLQMLFEGRKKEAIHTQGN